MYFTLVLSVSAFSTGAYSAYHLTLVTQPARRQLAATNIAQCKPTACVLGQLPAQATVDRAGRDCDHVLHAYGTISSSTQTCVADRYAFLEPWCAGLRGQHATEGRFTGRSALDEYWWA